MSAAKLNNDHNQNQESNQIKQEETNFKQNTNQGAQVNTNNRLSADTKGY